MFLSKWYDYIVSQGGVDSWKYPFHNYPMPYIYLLTFFSYLPLEKLYAVKLLSVTFDFMAAFMVFKIVRLKYKDRFGIPVLAAAVFLFTPTVFMNSSGWGQCDVIYTAFLLVSGYYCLKQKYFLTFLFFGIAFSFKIQSVFFVPVLFLFWYKERFNLLCFFIIPAVYLVSILPAFIAGRGMVDLLSIYIHQSDLYPQLNLNAPNFYAWISNDYYDALLPIGLLFSFLLVCMAIYFIIRQNKKISTERWIEIMLLFLLLVPYTLPKMHERYFFPADTFSVLYLFYFVKRYYLTLVTIGGSLLVYPPINHLKIPEYAMILTSFALFFTVYFLFRSKNRSFL
ncbi:hypothetical protein FACS189437_08130 [Bacteroidia bacterium]|nr:hypothetical protein FACS189437_08130 [Bacteroidia bacterium]